jgi:hypothetical protein
MEDAKLAIRLNYYTLDYFNLKNVSLIKIDVEGHEFNDLSGMLETLKNNNFPTIIMEIWSFSEGGVKDAIDKKNSTGIKILDTYMKTTKLLSKLEYVGYYITTDDFIYVHKTKLNKLHNFLNKK